jgi:N-methylhydantoinase A
VLRDDPASLVATADALATVIRTALPDDASVLDAEIDARYAGQSYELTVPLDMPITGECVADAEARFHEAHRQRYGHALPSEPIEVVTLRLRGTHPSADIDLPREPQTETSLAAAHLGTYPLWFDAKAPTQTPCYDRDALHHGHQFDGPAAIYQYDTTMVIPEGWHARVDAWRNLQVENMND